MDHAISSAIISAGIAIFFSSVVLMLPRKSGNGTVATHTEKIQELQAKYEEIHAENKRLRDEFQKKLIEYTTAYNDWNKRESIYQNRIRLLEAKVEQLTARIRGLEGRTGQSEIPREDDLIVIGIWPDPTLNIQFEADALYNAGFEYRRVEGENATRTNVIREVERHSNHKLIIEVGAHGTDAGTQLYDGLVKPGWWRRILQDKPIQLVALLSCDSDAVGDALHAAGIPAVISMQDKIADMDAAVFAIELYRKLATGQSINEAVDSARLHVSQESWEMIRLRETT